jgi:predicted metal-dependent hydrolase
MVPETARRRGIDLFNAGEFFECHEVLEDLWRPNRGEERFFLQALIHYAVAFHHHRQGNPVGARLQLEKGIRKLAGYLPQFQGIDTARLYREGQDALGKVLAGEPIRSFPRIVKLNSPSQPAPAPASLSQ